MKHDWYTTLDMTNPDELHSILRSTPGVSAVSTGRQVPWDEFVFSSPSLGKLVGVIIENWTPSY